MPRDKRPFITIHDGMPEHPKVDPLSDGAFRLLISLWCLCSRNKTDGELSMPAWKKRGTARQRDELITAGLVEVGDDKVLMHDYLLHQRSAKEIAELTESRRAAGSKGGKSKANGLASATATAKQDGGNALADTDTERTRHSSSSNRATRGTRLPDDWKPPRSEVEWRRENGISDLVAQRELPKFNDFWHAKAGKDAVKLDWLATWRNWLRNAQERSPTSSPQRPATNPAEDRFAAFSPTTPRGQR